MFDTPESQEMSLRSLFLRRQILAFCTVLFGVTVLSLLFLYAGLSFNNENRMVALAISLENQIQTTTDRRFFQHVVTDAIHAGAVDGVIVFDKSGDKVLGAAANTNQPRESGWLLRDEKVRSSVKRALKTGKFGFNFQGKGGRTYTVLPYKKRKSTAGKGLVLIGELWPVPRWHKIAARQSLSAKQYAQRIVSLLSKGATYSFDLVPTDYDGVIVLQPNNNWVSQAVLRGIVILFVMLGSGLLLVQMFLSRVLKTIVLVPLRQFSNVIARRRDGALDVRAPVVGIADFDKLARQWNSLLDYRDVAQSQNIVLSTLLEHVPIGIQVSDHESKVEYANPAFLQMTGLTLAEVVGKTPVEMASPFSIPIDHFGDVLVRLTDGENWSGEVVGIDKDGAEFFCILTIVPIFDSAGQIERVVTLHHDISAVKEHEKVLLGAKIRAELADKAKSEFIANMSHELRTPLNAMIGFSELMVAEKFGPMGQPEYLEFSKLIESSSRTLLASINAILELSRLDCDQVDLRDNRVSVADTFDQVIRTRQEKADARGIPIYREVSFGGFVKTDEKHFNQSIGFLVCNALRYNRPDGKVMLKAFVRDGELVIAVEDTGIGMSADQVTEITKPFYRVDNGPDRKTDGVGLGLTLVKRYAEAHQIKLNISSVENEGTVVELVFPQERVIQEDSKPDAGAKMDVAVVG